MLTIYRNVTPILSLDLSWLLLYRQSSSFYLQFGRRGRRVADHPEHSLVSCRHTGTYELHVFRTLSRHVARYLLEVKVIYTKVDEKVMSKHCALNYSWH